MIKNVVYLVSVVLLDKMLCAIEYMIPGFEKTWADRRASMIVVRLSERIRNE